MSSSASAFGRPGQAPGPRGASPVEAAQRALQTLEGALAATEAAARALAGQGPPGMHAALAALHADPQRQARAEAMLRARRGAYEARERARRTVAAISAALGPVARLKAAADLDLPGLQARAAALVAASRVLKTDPAMATLLPSAFGRLPDPPATSAQAPLQAAPDSLEAVAVLIAPLYRYTVARTPYLEAGIAGVEGRALPAQAVPLIAQALAKLYTEQAPALVDSRQALVQVAALRRGLLAARDPAAAPSAAQLRGLAMPLARYPSRFAPYPVLQALFPPMQPLPAARGQRP